MIPADSRREARQTDPTRERRSPRTEGRMPNRPEGTRGRTPPGRLSTIQCVPNFSEGRDAATIDAIAGAIAAIPGVQLVDASADADHHRMVITFVGQQEAVVNGALAGAAEAARRIDLTTHAGEHPRLGAV